MKKVLIATVVSSLITIISPLSTFAASTSLPSNMHEQETTNLEQLQASSSFSVDEFLSDARFNELPKTEENTILFKGIEDFKNENPNLSNEQIVEHFNWTVDEAKNFSTLGFYEETKATWSTLTPAEKLLVVGDPGMGYATISTRDKAYSYTLTNYGHSGAGDESDAFRHAVWNALMCKHISKMWANLMATAHENVDDAYLTRVFADGFTGAAHKRMDLHNNEKGRDCWNVLTDFIVLVSDGDLQNRVIAKIRAGEMIILHN